MSDTSPRRDRNRAGATAPADFNVMAWISQLSAAVRAELSDASRDEV